ncbi:uncharacterized protein A1O9_09859 [Exophiala aquamarina CBS 119918]|uniref:UBL3-like ubiquitin domain-containing protein n=1 Tax=Exophiala aquamarina CBS 119918 TaxID=1182545 RepID=A0A072P1R5_9EURO|nr:uncharacterized protein A1O9_09859 [Exophiala aquamarina CBS 119918]KEF54064.1 hypothetical protein A1O9_09859 [Exophiala aquamarina CBS 119918]
MSPTPDSTNLQPQSEPVSDTRSAAQDIPQQSTLQVEIPASTPVEMSDLPSKPPPSDPTDSTSSPPVTKTTSTDSSAHPHGPQRVDTRTAIDQSLNPEPSPPLVDGSAVTRTFSTAIGPSSDSPVVPTKDSETTGPVLQVTLLLTSGARHPFKLDSKYLNKRSVDVPGGDPFNLSVYKLKELILREWRDEWEAKPSSPNYIRLISFGKLLDDKAPLKDYKFSAEAPNVLHMTIKPQDFVEEDDAKGGKSSLSNNREAEGRSPGCRCVIM